MSERRSKYWWLLTAASTAMLLAACGGSSSSSNGDDDNDVAEEDDDPIAETATIDGTATVPEGTEVSDAGWSDYLQQLAQSVIASGHAFTLDELGELGLMPVPADTAVALISLGNPDEVIASTVTDGDGNFSFDEPEDELPADVVIRVGDAAPIRGPLSRSSERNSVNPVSEAVVRNAETTGDFSSAKLAAVVEQITRDLRDQSFEFAASVNVDDSVNEIDEAAGDEVDDLVAATRGDAPDMLGAVHLAAALIDFGGFGDEADFILEQVRTDAEIRANDDGEALIDLGGKTLDVDFLERLWSFDLSVEGGDRGALDDFDVGAESLQEQGVSGDFAPMLIGSNGRLTFRDGRQGIVTDDGDVFATTNLEAGSEFALQNLVFGARHWDVPTDRSQLNQQFNMVRFGSYLVEIEDFDNAGDVGFNATLAFTGDLDCDSTSCSMNLADDPERDQEDERFRFWGEMGPHGRFLTGGSSFSDDGSLEGFEITDTGALGSDGTSLAGGFLVPNAAGDDVGMLVAHVNSGDATGVDYPFQDLYLGLPAGQACSPGVLDGRYNIVGQEIRFQGGEDNTLLDQVTEFDVATFRSRFDVEEGEVVAVGDERMASMFLKFDTGEEAGAGAFVDVERRVDADEDFEPFELEVGSDCTFVLDEQVTDEEVDIVRGMVSPDGRVVVLAGYVRELGREFELGGGVTVDIDGGFVELIIGLRAPAVN